jgi:sulfur carrier protein
MWTEIIPSEPDAASTAEGKSKGYCYAYLRHSFLEGPFLKFSRKTLYGMEIIINGQSQELNGPISVGDLLSQLFPEPAKGIAVAINHAVVPKTDWPARQLQSNDHVTLITATQGG